MHKKIIISFAFIVINCTVQGAGDTGPADCDYQLR